MFYYDVNLFHFIIDYFIFFSELRSMYSFIISPLKHTYNVHW